MIDYDDEYEEQAPSKSQIKREMHALQDMGKALSELTPSQLAGIDVPDEVREAITELLRIRSNEAKRRQLQYIGKLMRKVDTDQLAADLESIRTQGTLSVQRQHLIEQWRDRMLDGDKQAVGDFIDAYPQVDIQHLRQLVRQALKEKSQQKAPAHARKLFRYLRDTMALSD